MPFWSRACLLLTALSLAACGSTTVTVPVPQTVIVPATVLATVEVTRLMTQEVTVEVPVEVTRLAFVTATASATPIPSPTTLLTPSRTPPPTQTPTLTHTPLPTATPTLTPDPFFFTGASDAIVNLLKPDPNGPALLHIIGNSANTFFSIKSFDVENNALAILVNTTTAYNGIVPIDFLPQDHTQRLELNVSGPWTIQVLPLTLARTLVVDQPLTGFGDEVILLEEGVDAVKITANPGDQLFGVFAYQARARDLIASANAPYSEVITLPNGTKTLEIKAAGPWTLESK